MRKIADTLRNLAGGAMLGALLADCFAPNQILWEDWGGAGGALVATIILRWPKPKTGLLLELRGYKSK